MTRHFRIVVVACLGVACSETAKESPDVEPTDAAPEPAAAEPPPEPEEEWAQAIVLKTTVLKKAPSKDKKIEDPESGKRVSNWVATLYRGESVELAEKEGDWVRARTGGEDEGWLKADDVVPDGKLVTCVADCVLHDEEMESAYEPQKTVRPGTLLLEEENFGDFSSVNYPVSEYYNRVAFMKRDKLVDTPKEISVAKLLTKYAATKKKGEDPSALADLANSQFQGSQLLGQFEALDAPDPELSEEARAMVGAWVCEGSKAYVFHSDGRFDYPENHLSGTWSYGDGKLTMKEGKAEIVFSVTVDKEKFVVTEVAANEKSNILCWTGGNSEIYSTYFKNRKIRNVRRGTLIGSWYNAEGFTLKSNGRYSYDGPDCGDGTWELNGMTITTDDEGCGVTEYEVARLGTHIMELENQALFRTFRAEGSVPTPFSK